MEAEFLLLCSETAPALRRSSMVSGEWLAKRMHWRSLGSMPQRTFAGRAQFRSPFGRARPELWVVSCTAGTAARQEVETGPGECSVVRVAVVSLKWCSIHLACEQSGYPSKTPEHNPKKSLSPTSPDATSSDDADAPIEEFSVAQLKAYLRSSQLITETQIGSCFEKGDLLTLAIRVREQSGIPSKTAEHDQKKSHSPPKVRVSASSTYSD